MTNTKIDMDTIVDVALGTIVNQWNNDSLNKKQEMMKTLLLHPEQIPIENESNSYSEWTHTDADDGTIRSEMKDILLDVLYDYAGKYTNRERPDGTGEGTMEEYEELMVKFWSDVPQDIKKTILFGDCLAFSLEGGMVVTSMESTTKHGDDDAFIYAMNKIMNYHEGKKENK